MVSFGAGGTNGKRKTEGTRGEGWRGKSRRGQVERESWGKGCRDSKGQQRHQKEWRYCHRQRWMEVEGEGRGRGHPLMEPRSDGESTHFFSRVFLRMKVMSFFSSRMQTRRPMTPPTTARMMSVTVLSTSSTGRGESGGGGEPCKATTQNPKLAAPPPGHGPLRSTKTGEA